MASEQSSAVLLPANPIEQYVILAKNFHGSAIVSLINQALDANGVYIFGELLEQPSVQEIAEGPDAKYYKLLKLFAYGICSDYEENKDELPELTLIQRRKLQQLTIVSLASKNKRIPYHELQSQLGINDLRELEDLIIETIYTGIIEGKLDQQEQMFEVDFAISRDVRSDSVDEIINTLETWCNRCDSTLKDLEDEIRKANSVKAEKEAAKNEIKNKIEKIKAMIKEEAAASGSATSPGKKETPSYLKLPKKVPREGGGLRGSKVGRD
ncbi:uncharacterized protein TRIADDRAFT_57554 [Trichoplax adhaerens]|uniref:PCI domain-containing protein n=1 Tax=Trichoplax adhaerens TaxID=10228 RepID=B3RZR9_TRIAD|nr:hypothetical protein TRIADDRAFT_57554 [Trichoplax adhaerens]EDV23886.1 hypothetical protein TRIADDRAFT_57554 [Trichoplax adhaerens]|eukprot:XP_002113412.1 hypothetical protein TRIADDRAFT_57554 [Trichoplax adhaerens]